jgi:hypothetical protein
MGLDDFLAGGQTRDDVLALASDELRPFASDRPMPHSEAMPQAPLRPTGELLDEIKRVIDRFIISPSRAAALTLALYVLHTWSFEAFEATPYLILDSPVKRAGKSMCERVLELLVRRPWRAVSTSEAALFRKINTERPTLLLDEVDRLFSAKADRADPIAAILNAGNTQGVKVTRMVGEGAAMQPADFEVFCPKVLAGINATKWPDTIVDRSIVLTLKRRKPSEPVERPRYRELRAETEALRAALARWGKEHIDALKRARPYLPSPLNDRQADAWEPLLAIAELADREHERDWADRGQKAAVKLSGQRDDSDEHGILALGAIHAAFDGSDALATDAILRHLNGNEELPFGGYRRGEGLDSRGLAKLLRPFDLRPRTVRLGGETAKGYRREQFEDAWARYLPQGGVKSALPTPSSAIRPSRASHRNNGGGFRGPGEPSQDPAVTDAQEAENPDEHWDVTDVTARKAENGVPALFDAATSDGRGSILDRYRGRPEKLAQVLTNHEAWERLTRMSHEPSIYSKAREGA